MKYKLTIEGTKKELEDEKKDKEKYHLAIKITNRYAFSYFRSMTHHPPLEADFLTRIDSVEYEELPEPKKVFRYKTLKELVEDFGNNVKLKPYCNSIVIDVEGYQLNYEHLGTPVLAPNHQYSGDTFSRTFMTEVEE